jgi:hypothetical protein
MTTTIKLKNGTGVPTSGALVQGEPAFDLTNKRLYTENAGGTVIEVGTNPSTLSVTGAATFGDAVESTKFNTSADRAVLDAPAGDGRFRVSTNSTTYGFFRANTSVIQIGTDSVEPLDFHTNNVFRMRLDASGNLGIGLSSPTDYGATVNTLEVKGASASGSGLVKVTGADGVVSGALYAGGSTSMVLSTQTNHALSFATNNTERMTLSAAGALTTTGTVTAEGLFASNASGGNVASFTNTSDADLSINLTSGVSLITPSTGILAFGTSSTEKMRLDASGNLGLGVVPSAWGTAYFKVIEGAGGSSLGFQQNANGVLLGSNNYLDSGVVSRYVVTDAASKYYQNGGVHTWSSAPSGTAGASITWTDAMTLDASGNLLVGQSVNNTGKINTVTAPSTYSFAILNTAGSVFYGGFYESAAGLTASWSGADTAMFLSKDTTSSRSINAAGTLNASGADYAEYEQNNGLTIIKGSVVGFKSDGTLTLTFSEAVRFAIKSTNPSYVGGDTWGTEEQVGIRPVKPADDADDEVVAKYEADLATFETALEAARQLVDRIAYSGKVPVNVQGATAGDYIIAVAADDGSIDGQAVSNPDFSQYKLSVGRVNRILDDGRAEVAVIIH